MMGHCEECPGCLKMIDHLDECEEPGDTYDITYRQCISTVRTALTSETEAKLESVERTWQQLVK